MFHGFMLQDAGKKLKLEIINYKIQDKFEICGPVDLLIMLSKEKYYKHEIQL